MSDPLAVKSSNRALNWATAAGVVGLAAAGFTLSFSALRDLAIGAGLQPELAFLWPLIVDGFIVVATAASFALKNRGRGVTSYTWAAIGLFAVVSVAGNASHAISNDQLTMPIWAATFVSAIPAVALLVASHLLVIMIDGKKRPSTKRPRADRGNVDMPATTPPVASAASARTVERAPIVAAAPPLQIARKPRPLVHRLRGLAAEGHEINAVVIAELEGVSERTGRRRLAELRETDPELFPRQTTQPETPELQEDAS